MKKKALRWAVVAVAASLALTSCATGTGSKTDDGTSYDPSAKLSGNLSILGFSNGDEIADVRIKDAGKALGSKVNIKLTKGALDLQQLLSAIAAGSPPDIIYANRDQIGSLASSGAIIPLDKCISGEKIDTGQYLKSALGQVTFNGSVYGIPEFNTVQLTMANSTLLKDAGLTIKDVNGSSWDAVSAAATKMLKKDGSGLKVIGVDTKLPEFLPLWAKSNGANLISTDGKKANLNDPKVVEALKFAVGVYNEQGGFAGVKAYRDSADFFGAGNQYATNALGSMWMEQWYVNVLNGSSPDAKISFDTFRDKQDKPIAYASGSAWAIPSGSKHAAAACRYARVMTQTSSWMDAAEARVALREKDGGLFTGLLTANQQADAKIKKLVKPSGSEQWDSAITAQYTANDHSFYLPANPADQEFKTAWQGAVNRVLSGQQEPKAALDQAQTEAQKALDKAWTSFGKKNG